MSQPASPKKGPYAVSLEQGKTCYWCACGRSANQPWCDGSHKGSDFEPVSITAEENGTVYLCGCKRTGNAPYCDGTHNR